MFLWLFSLPSLISPQSVSLFLGVEWKVPLLRRIKAEEKPGPGLIHVAHTGGMLCMDNWLSKQHGHRWILMVLPKCHLTDVTVAPILKRLVSKASIQAHSSPTESGRDSAVCQASISEGQISHLQPYLCRTVHPLPEGHWTFPIIGIYHSAFRMEIKSMGMVRWGERKNRHNCTGLFRGSFLVQKPWKITPSCKYPLFRNNKEAIIFFVGMFTYQFYRLFWKKIIQKHLRHWVR